MSIVDNASLTALQVQVAQNAADIATNVNDIAINGQRSKHTIFTAIQSAVGSRVAQVSIVAANTWTKAILTATATYSNAGVGSNWTSNVGGQDLLYTCNFGGRWKITFISEILNFGITIAAFQTYAIKSTRSAVQKYSQTSPCSVLQVSPDNNFSIVQTITDTFSVNDTVSMWGQKSSGTTAGSDFIYGHQAVFEWMGSV